jgi:glyoxylase-like metal-dependent hydrolase (beta-lactamase superfamily II)
MLFKQIKGQGSNFSYIIADENTKEAAVVDPDFNGEETKSLLAAENLKLLFIIDTHDHIDHIIGNDELKVRFGAKTVAHRLSKIATDLRVDEGDVVRVGSVSIEVLYTPGHSNDSICLLVNDKKLLTGDTLYVGNVGPTTMPGGDSTSMYDSIKKLLPFGDDVEVYPGHDRGIVPSSTMGNEKKQNKALQARNHEEFVKLIRQQ